MMRQTATRVALDIQHPKFYIRNSTFYIQHYQHYHDIVPRYPCTDRCGGFLYASAR